MQLVNVESVLICQFPHDGDARRFIAASKMIPEIEIKLSDCGLSDYVFKLQKLQLIAQRLRKRLPKTNTVRKQHLCTNNRLI